MEFTREKAEQLNKLAEYSLQQESSFDVGAFGKANGLSYEYMQHLLSLGKSIIDKHSPPTWIKLAQTVAMKTINTKAFLDAGGFVKLLEDEEKEKSLKAIKARKDTVGLANAERVYKSYPLTRALAWVGAISGGLTLLLKLAEMFGILPKSK